MSNQLQITGGAKVRSLEGVITGTSGVLGSVPLGAANGVATLDSGGKVPVSQLPSSVVTYLGTWNAATNTPTLVNGVGDAGDMYICNVAGTVNFGAGPVTFAVGDWVLYGSGTWQKSNGQNGTVTSVGLSTNAGAITIGNSPITTSGVISANFNGTNLQYVNGAGNLTTFPTLMTSVGLTMPSAFTVTNSPLTGTGGTLAVTGAGTVSQYIDGTGALQTFPALTGYVPYTGATADVDLGTHVLNAQALHVKGTAGAGHLGLKHQTASPTGSANESLIFADVNGNLGWQNDNLYLTTLVSNANTANRSYTFPNASGTLALTSDISYPVTSVFGRTGAVTAQSGDYTTTLVTEGTRLYYTDARARAALSFTAGSGAYNSTTGVITIPTNNNQITNGAGYITLTSLSAGTGISYNNLTGVITSTITQYTDAMARAAISGGTGISYNSTTGVITNTITQYTDALVRAAISLTTTGTSGAATYNSTTGVLNIPQYTDAYTGTVTSVAMTVPTGLSVSGSPITTSGTLAVTLTAGYSIPTTASQTNWDTAYTNRITSATSPLSITSNVISISQATTSTSGYLSSTDWNTFNSKQGTITLTTTGSSGAATFVGNTLNIPNYGSALSGYLPLTGGTLTGGLTISMANYPQLILNSSNSNGGLIYFQEGGITNAKIGHLTQITGLQFSGDGTNAHLTIASSGAATFTSSVTATSIIKTGGTSSQYLMADGSTSTLTNPVTGTGTANYLPKFTAGTTIGNSIIYDNGSRVMVNLSNYTGLAPLSVKGNSPYNIAFEAIANDGNNAVYIRPNNSGFNLISSNYLSASPYLPLSLSGREANSDLVLFTDGNAAFGTTTNAGYKLDVNGTGRFSGSLLVNSSITSRTSGVGTLNLGTDTYSYAYTAGQVIATSSPSYSSSGKLSFKVLTWGAGTDYGPTEQMYIDVTGPDTKAATLVMLPYGGNVGIGTSSPTFKFDVQDATQAIIRVLDASSNNSLILQAGTGAGMKITGYNYATSTAVPLYISVDGANTIMQRSGGNVLIGTTTDAGYKLDVNGTGRFSGNLTVGGIPNTISSLSLTRLQGYSNYYDVSNRYGDYGKLIFNADSSWTSGSRRWLITNAVNNTNFAIIRSVDSTTDPSLGNAGSVTSGTVDFQISNTGAATFSSSVTAQGMNINGASDAVLSIVAPSATAYVSFRNVGGKTWGIGNSFVGTNTNFQIYNLTDNVNALSFVASGAATFSSTIKTAGFGSTTAQPWKLGQLVTATVIGVNTTGYLTVEVNGSQYNLALANLA